MKKAKAGSKILNKIKREKGFDKGNMENKFLVEKSVKFGKK